ncbi:MAG: tetratricopeptide repeat protein [Syntrophobacteraceae bacterium]
MTSATRRIHFISLLCLGLVLGQAQEVKCAETTLHALRVGKHDEYSRIVLDLEGGRPVHIGIGSETEFLIRFTSLKTSVKPESLNARLPKDITRLSFEVSDDGFQIRIGLNSKTTREKHFFLQEKGGPYRLVIDLYVSGAEIPPVAAEQPNPPPPEQVAPKKAKPGSREKKKKETDPSLAQSGKVAPPEAGPAPPGPADDLFQVGHTLFESYQTSLKEHAEQIVEEYKGALKTAPGSPQAPLALYRLGLTYLAIADYKRGEECLRRLLASSPRHPLVPLCWLHLGRANEQRKAPLEAIQALRTALTHSLEKTDAIEAYYSLGKALSQVNAHTEVLEAIKKSWELDPLAYRARPELLRLAGESLFATQQYEKATEHMLWYLNLADATADRDMLLAKLAESLMYQKEPALAKRVYSYIERHHPETDGNVISKIRRAEFLEKQDGNGKEAARFIYLDLADKGLTGPLGEYVQFKLATWERDQTNYAQSLELIDRALGSALSATSKEEFQALRSQVVIGYAKQAVANKDHARVIALYNQNAALFQTPEHVDLLEAVGSSCMALKLYPNALDLYKQAQSHGNKSDELMLKMAQSQLLMGDLNGAAQQLQLVRSDNLTNQKAAIQGKIAFAQHQYKDAILHFAKVLAHDNELERADLDTVLAYAESLAQTGKQAEAIALMSKATAVCPGASEADNQLQIGLLQSRCFMSLKQPDKAITTLEHLVSIGPPDDLRGQLTYQLAELYLENQQPGKAKEKLSQLAGSAQGLWKTAAQQQLDYLDMQDKGRLKTN